MALPTGKLTAHSLAEVYLYLMATSCDQCGGGPIKGTNARPDGNDQEAAVIAVACSSCGEAKTMEFDLPNGALSADEGEVSVFNPGDAPSLIIDVAQWLTLFRAITETAAKETDKVRARQLGIEAAQCLEEAVKFYDDPANDLPPDEAFFHDRSRRRFQEHPQQFSRTRLIGLRAKLPSLSRMRARAAAPREKKRKRWWRRGE